MANLIDELYPVIDEVRSLLFEEDQNDGYSLGLRGFNVLVVTRTWDGGRVGAGVPDDSMLWLRPSPRVSGVGPDGKLRPGGLEEEGGIVLSGVSLKYRETELYKANDSLDPEAGEFFYVLLDKNRTGADAARARFYVPQAPPFPARADGFPQGSSQLDDLGWLVRLRRIADVAPFDAPNMELVTVDGETVTVDGREVFV